MAGYIYYYLNSLISKYSIKNSDVLVSISDSFVQWSNSYSKRKKDNNHTIFLTTKRLSIKKKIVLNNNKIKLCFIGNLNEIYDFDFLYDYMKSNPKVNDKKLLIDIYGIGKLYEPLKKKYKEFENVNFEGFLSYANFPKVLSETDILFAPYEDLDDFNMSVPNKIIDSISFQKPILTSLQGDTKNIINKYKCGATFNLSNIDSFKKAIKKIDSMETKIKCKFRIVLQ